MKKVLSWLLSVIVVCLVFVAAAFADNGSGGITGIIGWVKINWQSVLEIIGAVVSLATIIVKLTPTPKDDNFLSSVINFLSIFSLVNPDGSFVGKKKD